MLLAVTVFGGVQLLSLGVIGEYAAKIYMEVKQRPRFNVESILDPSDKKDSLSRKENQDFFFKKFILSKKKRTKTNKPKKN